MLTFAFFSLSAASIAVSIVSIQKISDYSTAGNTFNCILSKIYRDFAKGEQFKEDFPKWPELATQVEILRLASEGLEDLTQPSVKVNVHDVVTETEVSAFEESLEKFHLDFQDETLPPINPRYSDRVVPFYIILLGSYQTPDTYLNDVYSEFDTKVKISLKLHAKFREQVAAIKEDKKRMKEVLNEMELSLTKISAEHRKINNSYLEYLFKINSDVNMFGANTLEILNWLILVLVPLNMWVVVYYAYLRRIQKLRVYGHFLWHLLYFWAIFFLITGWMVGTAAGILKDMSQLNFAIFGEPNLVSEEPRILKYKQLNALLNDCINREPQLSKSYFFTEVEAISKVTDLYATVKDLQNIYDSMGNSNSEAIARNNMIFTRFSEDIASTGENDQASDTSPFTVMKILNRLTNIEVSL